MAYVLSENIDVFPATNRTYTEDNKTIKSRLMSEDNITNIIKSIADYNSFVLNYDSNKDNGGVIEFILNGYYFRITYFDTFLKESNFENNVYAKLKNSPSSSSDYSNTLEQDKVSEDVSKYEGIEFVKTSDADTFLLLQKDGDGWKIPSESFYKYNVDSINLINFPKKLVCKTIE